MSKKVPKVTIFSDLSGSKAKLMDFDPKEMVLNPPVYKQKKDMPLLRFARFGAVTTPKGSLRHDRNLVAVTGLELDYDQEQMSYEDAVARAREYSVHTFVYTSPSHTPERPRWRVLAPFSTELILPLEDMKLHRLGCVHLFEHILGVRFNSDTTKITQSYFFGRVENVEYQATAIPGTPIDKHLDLPFFIEEAKATSREAMDQEQKIRDLETGENITESAMSLIGKQVQAGMSRDFIITTMTAMIEKAEGRSPATIKQRLRDLPRQVDNIIALHKRNNPDQAQAPRPEDPESGLRLMAWDDITESQVEDQLIEDVLTVNASSMMIANYNVGKSALALDMCIHIAAGETWAGKQVEQAPCIYVAAEGTGSIQNRILAYRDEYASIPVYVLPAGGWTLGDNEGRLYFMSEILKCCRELELKKVGLVAIDTLAESAPGVDENSSEMGEIISWSKQLATKIHGHVMTIHHQAKHSPGSRGHTSAPAAADTLFQLTEKTNVVTAKLTKQRDLGTRGEGVQFKVVGYDTGQVSNFGKPVQVARVEYITTFGVVDEDAEPGLLPSGKLERDVLTLLGRGPYTGTWTKLCKDAWTGDEQMPSRQTAANVRKNLVASGQMSEEGTNRRCVFTKIDANLDDL